METLDVKPTMLLKVKDFAVLLVDFSVTMRPNACLAKPKQWMHSRSEKVSAIFLPEEIEKSCHGVLHGFFEE